MGAKKKKPQGVEMTLGGQPIGATQPRSEPQNQSVYQVKSKKFDEDPFEALENDDRKSNNKINQRYEDP